MKAYNKTKRNTYNNYLEQHAHDTWLGIFISFFGDIRTTYVYQIWNQVSKLSWDTIRNSTQIMINIVPDVGVISYRRSPSAVKIAERQWCDANTYEMACGCLATPSVIISTLGGYFRSYSPPDLSSHARNSREWNSNTPPRVVRYVSSSTLQVNLSIP